MTFEAHFGPKDFFLISNRSSFTLGTPTLAIKDFVAWLNVYLMLWIIERAAALCTIYLEQQKPFKRYARVLIPYSWSRKDQDCVQ